jgi:hypothetical protein
LPLRGSRRARASPCSPPSSDFAIEVIGEIANVVRLGARQRREGAIWGFGKIGCRERI